MSMNARILIIILCFNIWLFTSVGQEIKVSDHLMLIKLTEHTYIHTGNDNNGIVYVNNGEAVIVSTPDSDAETQNLIDWTRKKLRAKIVGYVIDRWHPDAMEGLDVVQHAGIKTYSYELTRKIAKEKGLPVPEIGFDPIMDLNVGGEKIICHFIGAAHTVDGIVVWIPKEKILFGGNEVRSLGSWYGNIGDADLKEWSHTIHRVKEKYGAAKIVIPGHGKYGGTELLDYTIDLYQPSKWGRILKSNNIQALPVFNDYGDIFEVAASDSVIRGKRYLTDAIAFVNHQKQNRYLKIQSQNIVHNVDDKMISSGSGRLQIFDKQTNELIEDLYYKQLYVNLRNDEVGLTIIIKEAIR